MGGFLYKLEGHSRFAENAEITVLSISAYKKLQLAQAHPPAGILYSHIIFTTTGKECGL